MNSLLTTNRHGHNPIHHYAVVPCACLVLMMSISSLSAAPLVLPQSPPGSGGREPAPNVIVTVDDSGSMGWDVNGCMTLDWRTDVYGQQNQDGATNCPPRTSNPNLSRMASLKAALLIQFGNANANPVTKGKIDDDRIRLAWQTMWNNGGSPGAGNLTAGATNAMRSFTGTHRVNFTNFINSLSPVNGTPSHQMMANVYNYMRSPAGTNSPWADTPGTAQTSAYLACRRTYHVFMTDGSWNSEGTLSAGNADGTARTLGDASTLYDPTSNQVRIYKDTYGGTAGQPSTLSDFAFRNWASDLQDGTNGTQNMSNAVKPLIKNAGTETVGNTVLQEFWNPKNDPATWQHIVQHTIGFGNSASTWTGDPVWNNTTDDTYGGAYSNLVNGNVTWQNPMPAAAEIPIRPSELWHAALNGRGKFYPARDPNALTAAFSDILNNIISDTSKPLTSIAANTVSLKSGASAYIAGYDSTNWSGKLAARAIDSSTGVISATERWNAATLLDDASYVVSNRFVLSYSGTAGISWTTWNDLPLAQKTPLNKDSGGTVDSKGQNRVDYLRGDRTKEVSQTSGVFRNRGSRLGDIVNSNIWYTGKPNSGYTANGYSSFRSTNTAIGGKGGRTPMVYVGANDGMLHGFAAGNWPSDLSITIPGGKELLSYIPQGVAENDLRKLTDTSYSHQYFVDGSPFVGDAFIGTTPTWKTILTGTLGAGGKGYFALDVTDPAQFTVANAANLVLLDNTSAPDVDVGNIMSPPTMDNAIAGKSQQVVKMNNGRWAIVLGNGYNSSNEAPVLVIQYLDGDKALVKISPCTQPILTNVCTFKGSNGLSTPMLIDLNGDGKVDIAYAGDIKGNLWKFDLSNALASNWVVSFSGQPFFVAKPSSTVTQSITTAPYWMPHPNGGIMVLVGTGQNLTTADQTSTGTDSVYALYDKSTYTTVSGSVTITDGTVINTTASTSVPSTLVQQTITGTVSDAGTTYFRSSSNPVIYTGTGAKRGWYLNWSISGQRVLVNNRLFSGQKILIQSTVPKSGNISTGESCTVTTSTERTFLTVLNMFTGNPSTLPAFTMTDSTISNTDITGMESKNPGDNILMRNQDGNGIVATPCTAGTACSTVKTNFGKYLGVRANWREIQ